MNTVISINSLLRHPTRIAPLLALFLMVLLPTLSLEELLNSESVLARNKEVASVFLDAPFKIGDWIGEPVTVPASAIEILHTNAILGRSFRNTDGLSAKILIVHCSNARDMQGHYPPTCYKANGWEELDIDSWQDHEVSVNGKTFKARVYQFRIIDRLGLENTARVINFFILPDGKITSEYDAISSMVSRLSLSIEGVAQVQIVTSGGTTLSESIVAAEELLSGFSSVMTVLGRGRENDYSN